VFTLARLQADKTAAPHAKPIAALLAAWPTVHSTQLALWDAQTNAEARIASADDHLDDFVTVLAMQVRAQPGGEKGPRWGLYFKSPPHALAAPVLGDELAALRQWTKHLAKEKASALAALKENLDALIAEADAAVKAKADADAANEHFRARGDLAKFVASVTQKRDALAATLDALATQNPELPRGYSSRFFRHRAAKPSVEEKQARAARKEAARQKRVEAEAKVKAAQAKVKAALQELRAAKKPK
jgi:hypothetical protein